MAKKIVIIAYKCGNHSPFHVYNHGKIIFEGNAKECKAELARMRNLCRNKWYSSITNLKMSDYIAYEMSDIFVVDITNGTPEWY